MSTSRTTSSSMRLLGCLTAALTGAWLIAGLAGLEASQTPKRTPALPGGNGPVSEIRLPVPQLFAVLLSRQEGVRRLHKVGDALFHPRDGTQAFVLEKIGAKFLIVRNTRSGKKFAVQAGRPLPGIPGLEFSHAVLLDRLEYRLSFVEAVTDREPELLEIEGSVAILSQQISGGSPDRGRAPVQSGRPAPRAVPPPRQPDALAKTGARQVGQDTYEVPEAVAAPLIEQAGQVLEGIRPRFSPIYLTHAPSYPAFESPLGSVELTKGGFVVSHAGLAQRFGVQVGDRVLTLNGRPVTSALSAWWTYQEVVVRNRDLSEIRVALARGQQVIHKTFRIR